MVPRKKGTCFFKGYRKECIFKIIKPKSIMFFSWRSWKSNKGIFLKHFPRSKFAQCHSLLVLIFTWNESLIILYLCYIFNFFHPTLTILKVVLALNCRTYENLKVSIDNKIWNLNTSRHGRWTLDSWRKITRFVSSHVPFISKTICSDGTLLFQGKFVTLAFIFPSSFNESKWFIWFANSL